MEKEVDKLKDEIQFIKDLLSLEFNSSEKKLELELKVLIGDKKFWSTESKEVLKFRDLMNSSLLISKKEPTFSLPKANILTDQTTYKKPIIIKNDLKTDSINLRKALLCPIDSTVDEYKKIMMNKLTVEYYHPDDLIFETETKELIYGNTKMIDIQYIRECVDNQRQPCITLIQKSKALNNYLERNLVTNFKFYEEVYVPKKNDISSWDIDDYFSIKLNSVSGFSSLKSWIEKNKIDEVFLTLEITHGPVSMSKKEKIRIKDLNDIKLDEKIELDVLISDLPREATLSIELLNSKSICLSKSSFFIFDYLGYYKNGKSLVKIYLEEEELNVEFEMLNDKPILFTQTSKIPKKFKEKYYEYQNKMNEKYNDSKLSLNDIFQKFHLEELSEEEKWVVWRDRDTLKQDSESLIRLLQCVNYQNPYQILLSHDYMNEWKVLTPLEAIGLLNGRFLDEDVREHGVDMLKPLSENDLHKVIYLLLECLRFEPYHNSPLSRFLIERASSSHSLSSILYWHLKQKMKEKKHQERYGLMLECLLSLSDKIRTSSLNQEYLNHNFKLIYLQLLDIEDKSKNNFLRESLSKLDFQKTRYLFDSKHEISKILVDKCKVTKDNDLWICYEIDLDERRYNLIKFNDKDDKMNAINVMRSINGLFKNLNYSPMDIHQYIKIDDNISITEVVLNSDSLSSIEKESKPYDRTNLDSWIKKHNYKDKKEYESSKLKLQNSFCVLTIFKVLLGIENPNFIENVWIKKDGHLFINDIQAIYQKDFFNYQKILYYYIPISYITEGDLDGFKTDLNHHLKVLLTNQSTILNILSLFQYPNSFNYLKSLNLNQDQSKFLSTFYNNLKDSNSFKPTSYQLFHPRIHNFE